MPTPRITLGNSLIILAVFVVGLLVAAALFVSTRPGANLAAEYEQRVDAVQRQRPTQASDPLAPPDMAALPAPVQRYLLRSGVLCKPRTSSFRLTFEAEMFSKPNQAGMRGVAQQLDVIEQPRRLFFMQTRMAGLPVAVLHDYAGSDASMRVRLASLFDVVDQRGDALARTETVTFLNDLCFFAPSALVDSRFTWRAIDDRKAEVQFTSGPHTVSATLIFDASGDLVNFISDDRAVLEPAGSLRRRRWSTPMRHHRDFGGRRLPTEGEAIWHLPEGDFVYGRFALRQAEFDAAH